MTVVTAGAALLVSAAKAETPDHIAALYADLGSSIHAHDELATKRLPVDHGPSFEDVWILLDWQRADDPSSAHLSGAAWIDYDADRDLDLFIPNAPGGDNVLLRNDDGVFTDVAAAAGITGIGL